MKKLLLIGMVLFASGCNAGVDEGKTVNQLQAEIEQRQAAIERAKISGGYPEVTPPAVCAYGVLYYTATTYGGSRIYTVAIDPADRLPRLCNQASAPRAAQ